jgi:hypothetical protein
MRQHLGRPIDDAMEDLGAGHRDAKTDDECKHDGDGEGDAVGVDMQGEEEFDAHCIDDSALDEVVAWPRISPESAKQ